MPTIIFQKLKVVVKSFSIANKMEIKASLSTTQSYSAEHPAGAKNRGWYIWWAYIIQFCFIHESLIQEEDFS